MPTQNHKNFKIKERIIVFAIMFFLALYSWSVMLAAAEGEEAADGAIDTGAAAVVVITENDINQNIVDTALPEEESGLADPGGAEILEFNEASVGNDITATGTTGVNGITDNTGTSSITTGDAELGAMTVNDINLNDAETASGTITIENINAATTTNNLELIGNSGGNEIASSSGDALITTGDIGIINIILNYINNNFFGPGKEYFINIFNHVIGAVDLSGFGGAAPVNEESGVCAAANCYLTVNNNNQAEIGNNIIIDANTGDNIIATSTGEGKIETGDIDIVNDLVNIANLNVAGNDWFFAVVNIFGELTGDIILPGPGTAATGTPENTATGTEDILAVPELEPESANIILANTDAAGVLNNININAATGDNQATGGDIRTGEVLAESHVFNLINYSVTGNAWKFARVNIFGHWDGFITGLPAGYAYLEDEYGITVYNDLLADPDFYASYAQMIVNNENQASTTNNIEINANTGNNSLLHTDGDIATGDINIKNSLLNFINSNFTGNSWDFSLINVFGDWQGNLAFGQSDLWVTEAMDAAEPVKRGDYINYTFLFGNKGDGLATEAKLFDDYDENYVVNEDGGEDGRLSWSLGDLPPNTQGSLSYAVRVRDDIPAGNHSAGNTVTISAAGSDRDLSDNSAGGTVAIDGGQGGGTGGGNLSRESSDNIPGGNTPPALVVIKTNDAADIVRPGDIVNYTIMIRNPGGTPMADVLVLDVLSGEGGMVEINRELWDLGAVLDREEVSLGYSLEITDNIRSGVYINEVTVEGYDAAKDEFIAVVASSKIKVENPDWSGFRPQLEIGLSGGALYVNPGDTVSYEAVITNNGSKAAKNTTLSGNLADGLTFLDEDGIINKHWNLEDLAPGEFENIVFSVQADETIEPGLYLISLEIKSDDSEPVRDWSSLEIKTVAVAGLSTEADTGELKPVATLDGVLDDLIGPPEEALAAAVEDEGAEAELDSAWTGENPYIFAAKTEDAGNKINLAPAKFAFGLLIVSSVLFIILTIIVMIKERRENSVAILEPIDLKRKI